jgi:hypothetical protein
MRPKRNPGVMRKVLLLMFVLRIPTHPAVSEVTVEGRYTRMRERPRDRKKETKGKERHRTPLTSVFFPQIRDQGTPDMLKQVLHG